MSLGPNIYQCFVLSTSSFQYFAFQISKLNENSENRYTDTYIFFYTITHFVCNFSRDKVFLWSFQDENTNNFRAQGGLNIEALDSHLINLPILIRFCDQQISSPHNNTIKKLKSKLEGV